MPKYIEREKVHRLVRSLNRYAWNNPDKSKYRTTVDIDDVQFGIDKIPAADVVEVRHGKWNIVDGALYWVDGKCSVCGYTDSFDESGFYKYCPECGAKMDEKDGENNA